MYRQFEQPLPLFKAMQHDNRTGRVADARWVPSPNFDDRPTGTRITAVIIHCISLPPGRYGGGEIERFFCNQLDHHAHPYFDEIRGVRVSAHFLIGRGGELIQFVSTLHRAWHAGRSALEGVPEVNDYSIGIELEGIDDDGFTDAQYATLAPLTVALMAAYPEISGSRLVGHCDIAPERKTDPGPGFDWQRYRRDIGV